MTTTSHSTADHGKRANRLMLYVPLALGAFVFIAYTIVWFIGAGMMDKEVSTWIDDQRSRGMTVEHGAIDIQGYPFLLRAKLEVPVYGNNQEGWQWQAETLYVDTLPYNPTRLVLTPNGEQKIRVTTNGLAEYWQITSSSIRSSLSQTSTAFELHDVEAVPEGGSSASGFTKFQIGRLRANTQISSGKQTGESTDVGSFAMEGQKIVLSGGAADADIIINFIDGGVRATAFQAFLAAASDNVGFSAWKQQEGQVLIDSFRLSITDSDDTPPSKVFITGNLYVDGQNYPAGQIDTSLTNHQAILSILTRHGVLSADEAKTADDVLKTLAAMMGNEMKLPLLLKDGEVQVKTPFGGATIARLEQLN